MQFAATRTKPVSGAGADGAVNKHPTLDALLNPSNGTEVSVFALKRDKQQALHVNSYEQAKNHLNKCKTLLQPNLLKVLGTYETSNSLYVVTECCFSLPYVLYLSQQQQQERELASKRPFALPQQQVTGSASQASTATPDGASYAASAAAAAAGSADSCCWNFLELIEAVSFLHDQCKLVHGELSPFSVFVTPHGKAFCKSVSVQC